MTIQERRSAMRVFMFPGQGSQFTGTGKNLFDEVGTAVRR